MTFHKKNKPLASISLDLDNQWSYMKIHGDEGWDQYPSYFAIFVPYVLDILDESGLKITFFIVGKDTEKKENRPYIKMITDRGHEVGNHSYNHESWPQTNNVRAIEQEILKAEVSISLATGHQTVGFRGPGLTWNRNMLKVLESRGYKYDASTLPSFWGPLARMYNFTNSQLAKQDRLAGKELFGKWSNGLLELRPYKWDLGNGKSIVEMPVTTMPGLKLPFHLSYLIYLSTISMSFMKLYLEVSIRLCKITNTPVSFLLHPPDLIGGDRIQQLPFFPGMNISSDKKAKVFKHVIQTLSRHYELVNMSSHFDSAVQNPKMKTLKLY
jgi:peptidoglycan/xylan/chitin deacetylase (PgdA/CDA1 family)